MYHYWKKVVAVTLLVSTLLVAGWTSGGVQAEGAIKIGVLQYVEHESLNQNYQGFVDGLKEAGYEDGDKIELNYLNVSGDNANLQSMSETLTKDSDYLFAIATPAAQGLANLEKETPIYFSSVTDPVAAKLVESLDQPGGNVTGTLDAGPLEEQVALIKAVRPNAKKVGLIYNSGEANSVFEAQKAKELIEGQGYQVLEQTVTSTNDISQAMTALTNEPADVIFTVTDNTIASAMNLVGDLAIEAGIPLLGGSKDMVMDKGLATYGLDYYELGKQTARMMVDQIENKTETSQIPVEKADKLEVVVNEEVAKALDIDPSSIQIE